MTDGHSLNVTILIAWSWKMLLMLWTCWPFPSWYLSLRSVFYQVTFTILTLGTPTVIPQFNGLIEVDEWGCHISLNLRGKVRRRLFKDFVM